MGLLKFLKSRLESEWHPRVPWPRYSRELTFQHSWPHPFSCKLEFWTVGFNPGPVSGSRFVAKTL